MSNSQPVELETDPSYSLNTSDYDYTILPDGTRAEFYNQESLTRNYGSTDPFVKNFISTVVKGDLPSPKPRLAPHEVKFAQADELNQIRSYDPNLGLEEEKKKRAKKRKSDQDLEELFTPRPLLADDEDKPPPMAHGEIVAQHPFRLLFSGASNTGKTTLFSWMIRKHFSKYFDHIYVFSKSAKLDPIYKSLVKHEFIHKDNLFDHFDEKALRKIEEENGKKVDEMGKKRAPRIYIHIDDLADEKESMNADVIKTLAFIARHYNISVSIGTQKYNAAILKYRTNSTNLYIFAPQNMTEADIIAREQAHPVLADPPDYSLRGTKAKFIKILNQATSDKLNPWSFLHINRQGKNRHEMYRKGLTEIFVLHPEEEQEEEKKKEETAEEKKKNKGKRAKDEAVMLRKEAEESIVEEGDVTAGADEENDEEDSFHRQVMERFKSVASGR